MKSPSALMVRRAVATTLLASMSLVTGCATYRPIDRATIASAGDVRLELTERGTLEMGPLIGAGLVSLDGRVVSVTDSSVRMSLKQVVARTGGVQQWVGEAVTIPSVYVNRFRQRQPSVARSIALGAGITAAAIAAALGFTAGNSGSARGDGNPIPK